MINYDEPYWCEEDHPPVRCWGYCPACAELADEEEILMVLELGKSYWLIGQGKVWITSLVTYADGAVFMARCQDVNKKDMGVHGVECFEEIEDE